MRGLWFSIAPGVLAAVLATSGLSVAEAAQVVRVTSLSALQSAVDKANPGDEIRLADGSYTASSAISVKRSGTSSARIKITAEHVGKAEIKGSTGFSFSGVSYVDLVGFNLRHGGSLSVPAEAHHVRLSRNVVQLTSGGNWVTVNGNDVQIDHNTFQNRSTEGVFLQVSGPGDDIAKRIKIDHNYFYNHTFAGSNGGESIRLGYSHKQSKSANAIVEYNLFEKANGDPEAISVKSSDNVIRYNTIRNSTGFIVLRHGNRTTVEGNLIFGASGIRVHGNDHKIVGNLVAASSGRAFVFGEGSEADSGPTSTGHDRPDRVTVAYNTLLGTSGIVTGDGGAFKPKDCVVANNIVRGTTGTLVTVPSGSTVRYEGNITFGATAGIPSKSVDPKLVKDSAGISRLAADSPAINAGLGSYPDAATDLDLQPRSAPYDVGADEYPTSTPRTPLTPANVGPSAP